MWAYTAKSAKILFINAYAFFPFLIFAVHMSYNTFFMSLAGVLFFFILDKFEITPKIFLRRLSSFFLATNIRRSKYRSKLYFRFN